MHAGCECNVVIETCPQRDLESTFLRCDNVAFTTLPQPKHNVVTTLSQRDFVCWVVQYPPIYLYTAMVDFVMFHRLMEEVLESKTQYHSVFGKM